MPELSLPDVALDGSLSVLPRIWQRLAESDGGDDQIEARIRIEACTHAVSFNLH